MSAIFMSSAAQQIQNAVSEQETSVPKCLRFSVSIIINPVHDLGNLFAQFKRSSAEAGPIKKEKVSAAPTPAPAATTTAASNPPTSPSKGKRVKQISKKAMRIQPTLVSQNVSKNVVDLVDDGIEGDSTPL